MIASINGKKIAYEIFGEGPLTDPGSTHPVLFLIHGGPGLDHSGFKIHSLDLQDSAQLVLFDLTGHGKSSGHPAEHTLESAIEDVEDLRRYLKLEKISCLGFSYGGKVALGYAIKYPERLDRLFLICTAHHFGFIEHSRVEFVKRNPTPAQLAVFNRLCDGQIKDRADFIEYFNQLGPLYSKNIAKQRALSGGVSTSTWDHMILGHEASNAAYRTEFWRYDYTSQLSQIQCPTLILGAEDDWMCPPEFSVEMAAKIPHAKLVIFEGCGHILPIDQNARYLELVRAELI
ncbi:MAG: alpha/beta hydrolase [Gammaproteobacteria bacterium]|nr:alpha/beta hydrolase [Gammaproteobacteria bacterium]